MKSIIIIILSVLLYSCSTTNMKPSYFTEAYIKTNLQEHINEEVSTISIRSKYKLYSDKGLEIQEYNFVEYKDKSYFVMTFRDMDNENPNIIILNKEECKKLLTGIVEIIFNAKSTTPIENNVEYFDYTVRKDIFFSALKNQDNDFNSYNLNMNEQNSVSLYIWFGGQKYRLNYSILIKVLEDFNSISK